MFCTNCGVRRADQGAFCPNCGTAFPASPAPGDSITAPGRSVLVSHEPASTSWHDFAAVDDVAAEAAGGAKGYRGARLILAGVAVTVLAIGGGAAAIVTGHHTAAAPAAPAIASATPVRQSATVASAPSATASAATFPALYKQVANGVVRIETTACDGGGVGSGFLIAPDMVATVAHVVKGAVSVVVKDGSRTTTGTVVGFDSAAEVALVRTSVPLTGHVFTLDPALPDVGTDVAAIGFPLAGQESLTKGSISGQNRTIDVGNGPLSGLLQTDATINPGNSGGPLLQADGTVVGLVDAKRTDASNIGYAVPASTASGELQGWRDAPTPVHPVTQCAAPTGPSGLSVNIIDRASGPDEPAIAEAFATYANGINTGNYESAWGVLSPRAQTLTPFDKFSQGEASSYIATLTLDSIVPAGAGSDTVEVEFTSVQDPTLGGTGQACSNWTMTYTLIGAGGSWLIDTARPHAGSPAAC